MTKHNHPNIIIPYQEASLFAFENKYFLRDSDNPGEFLERTPFDVYARTARTLASNEKPKARKHWEKRYLELMSEGKIIPAGRILSNAGSEAHKTAVSLINCTVSQTIHDSIEGIMAAQAEAVITLKYGCGIGYEFSTLRPEGAHVRGAGASTSGPLSFMVGYDTYCDTVQSAGGRRGAQMATFDVSHPDVLKFIQAKRNGDAYSQFNFSLLITDAFINAVKNDEDWQFMWDGKPFGASMPARELWDVIMTSTYNFWEPGFLLIDRINRFNNNWFCEILRATNPCGEQPLPPWGSCLLGSVNLVKFIRNPLSHKAEFDWAAFEEAVQVFTRMLDSVVEFSGLPLEQQLREIKSKRRHGMGYMGLGSALALLGIRYGSKASVDFTRDVTRRLAAVGYQAGAELAKEKGMAPVLRQHFDAQEMLEQAARTGNTNFADYHRSAKKSEYSGHSLWLRSHYFDWMREEEPAVMKALTTHGCRFTHATSIAPTGTIAFGVGNNASNGIEPSYGHRTLRNMIVEGQSTKRQFEVFSYEFLVLREHARAGDENVLELIRQKNPDFDPRTDDWKDWEAVLPDSFSSSDNVTPIQHVDVQAASQRYVDSSISKTINCPTDIPYEEFKSVYMYAYEMGLKGCTTYRYNPAVGSGVLVRPEELASTYYKFTTSDGRTLELRGDQQVEYKGEVHIVANLADAIKTGTYGRHK